MTKLSVVSPISFPSPRSPLFSIRSLNAEEQSWPRRHSNANFRTSSGGKTFLLEGPLTSFVSRFSFFSLFFSNSEDTSEQTNSRLPNKIVDENIIERKDSAISFQIYWYGKRYEKLHRLHNNRPCGRRRDVKEVY